jgi:hypothetical protein
LGGAPASVSFTSSSLGDDLQTVPAVFKSRATHKVTIGLYKPFLADFDAANNLLEDVEFNGRVNAVANDILKEFRDHARLRGLTVQYHLLEIVQRLPRYRLMIEEYQKCFRVTRLFPIGHFPIVNSPQTSPHRQFPIMNNR